MTEDSLHRSLSAFRRSLAEIVIGRLQNFENESLCSFIDNQKTAVLNALSAANGHGDMDLLFIQGTIKFGEYCHLRSQYFDFDLFLPDALAKIKIYDLSSEDNLANYFGKLHHLSGRLKLSLGKTVEALECFESGLREVEQKDPTTKSGLLLGCAICYEFLGHEAAVVREEYEKSIQMARLGDSVDQLFSCLSNYIGYLVDVDAIDAATQLVTECNALSDKISDRSKLSFFFTNYGVILGKLGDFEGERDKFQSALDVSLETNRIEDTLYALTNLGALALDQGKLQDAEAYFRRGLHESRKIGHLERNAALSRRLGTLQYRLGELDEADEHFRESVEEAIELGHPKYISAAKVEYGCFLVLIGSDKGKTLIKEAYALAKANTALRYFLDSILDWVDEAQTASSKIIFQYSLNAARDLEDHEVISRLKN